MKTVHVSTLLSRSVLACAALLSMTAVGRGGTVYNGWNYALDSQNDGSGGAIYEDRGLAFMSSGGTTYFAISSGMNLGGNPVGGALNGSIANGDLFINFSGNNLTSAAAFNNPLVFGVRFDAANDSLGNSPGSPNATLGVYSNVTTAALASANSGFTTYQSYLDAGFGRVTGAAGDLQSSVTNVIPYLGNGIQQTNIASGTKIGEITILDRTALSGVGLDFGHFAGADPVGNFVYGFSFSSSLLPQATFTAHRFQECTNDLFAIQADTISTPEPSTLISAVIAVTGMAVIHRRKARTITRA